MKAKIIIVLLLAFKICFSQEIVNLNYCKFDKENRFYEFKQPVLISNIFTDKEVFKNNNDATYIKKWSYTDITGIKHHCYTQKVNNIPILFSEIYARERNDTLLNMTGLTNINVPENNNFITSEEAINKLNGKLNCVKYKWRGDISNGELFYSESSQSFAKSYQTSVCIIKMDKNIFDKSENYKYCYPISISAIYSRTDSIYKDSTYYVDATTGDILKSFSSKGACFNLKEINTTKESVKKSSNIISPEMIRNEAEYCPICSQSCMTTNVPITHYGNQNINTEKFLYGGLNCTHRLKDNCTGTFIYVMRRGSNSGNLVDYRNNPNTWLTNNGAYTDDIIGTSTLWSLEMTHDFFRNTLNRNSYDNAFSQIFAETHSYQYVGAGTSWIYSSAQGTNFIEVYEWNGGPSFETTLDVLAHEFTHGVADNICSLSQQGGVSNSDEEGILMEGYGDIFGQAVENFVNNNFTVSGSIDDFYQGSNLSPQSWQKQRYLSTPKSNGHPDTYQGTFWAPAGSTFHHNNSTVISHWYFLLAQGGSGQNDLTNNYCVSGIGQAKAIQIAYLSLFKLGGTAKQIADARVATIQAAIQLYGANSNEVAQVTAAWFAVGVGANYTGQIDVKNHTATGVENYTQWNCKVEVANFTSSNGSDVTITSNTEVSLQPDLTVVSGAIFSAFITPACNGGARLFNPGVINTTENSSENTITEQKKSIDRSASFDIIPNPSEGIFKLVSSEDSKPSVIIVTDMLGGLVKEIKVSKEQDTLIDLNEFPDGMYFIKVLINETTITKRIIKN
jgi:Zn-dependent metalloprotease